MNEYISSILGQVIRHALTLAAGLLTAYGVTADQQEAFIGPTTAVLVSIVLFIISQIWGAKAKAVTEEKIDTALKLPANSSRAKLEDVVNG